MGGTSRWTREELAMLVEFGVRLRHARHDAGLTQEKVERWYGIHRAYVSQVEQGRRNSTFLMIVRLATIYGLDPGTLVRSFRHSPNLWPFDPVQPQPLPPPDDE